MATINYTKTKFIKPWTLNQAEYISLRNAYFENPNFKYFEKSETFTEHFADTIKIIKYGFYIGIGALILINVNETIGSILSIIAIPMFFLSLLILLLEGPSYASFLKDKENYEDSLKNAVMSSSNYEEFVNKYDKI